MSQDPQQEPVVPIGLEHIAQADTERVFAGLSRMVKHNADNGGTGDIDVIMVGVPPSLGLPARDAIVRGLQMLFTPPGENGQPDPGPRWRTVDAPQD